MSICVLSIFLFIFPLTSLEPDRVDQATIKIKGCNGKVGKIWIKSHNLYIDMPHDLVTIPLPPVREPLETWIVFDVQSDRVKMGNWGLIYVQRGPKEAI